MLVLYKQQSSLPPPIRAPSQHTHTSQFGNEEPTSQGEVGLPLSRDLGASHTGKATMEVPIFLLSLLAAPLRGI